MRLRHIEVFHAGMRAGSLSGAASLLNMSFRRRRQRANDPGQDLLSGALVESGIGFTIIDKYTAQSAADTFAVRQIEPALSVDLKRMQSLHIGKTDNAHSAVIRTR